MTPHTTDPRGEWMQTIGGRRFYPQDPRPEDVYIEDIAHALSHICRFGGHCHSLYTVAEHSVRVSAAIAAAGGTAEEQRQGLLHDAAEAYVGDMVWPLKRSPQAEGYRTIEHRVEQAIAAKFGLPVKLLPIVKRFDLTLLSTEKRDLMNEGPGREDGAHREAESARAQLGKWHSDDFEPLPERITPWSPTEARRRFLVRYVMLSWGSRPDSELERILDGLGLGRTA